MFPKPAKRGPKPRRRARRARKGSRAALGREADRLWSLIVRGVGRCEACGSKERLQAAHGFSRRYRATRWDLRNGVCLCAGCHVRYTHDPLGWEDWLKFWLSRDVYTHNRLGGNLYLYLREIAQKGRVPKDLEGIVKGLQKTLDTGGMRA
jgi:hypothetical protein